VHAGAVRTFEIVVVDRDNFCGAIAASGAIADVDLFHDLGKRIFAEVELGHAEKGLTVLGKKKFIVLLLLATIESDGQSVVVGEFARLEISKNYLDAGWNGVKSSHLLLDTPGDFGRR